MVWEYFIRHQDEQGIPPTIRQVMDGTDITSTSIASYNLNKLVKKGLLDHFPGQSRAYRLSKKGKRVAKQVGAV